MLIKSAQPLFQEHDKIGQGLKQVVEDARATMIGYKAGLPTIVEETKLQSLEEDSDRPQ